MYCKTEPFLSPVIPGHEHINFPTLSFLIHNTTKNKKVLFDVGGRTDYWNYAPFTLGLIRASSAGMVCEKGVDEILTEKGITLDSLDAIIWSHGHFDHLGDCSKFPSSVKIVVGEGFIQKMLPGYPANPMSPLLESDYAGHEMEEIKFSKEFKIGQFQAYDYFGDGSFYLLDVPGHAPGHICGLVRTTPSTFVFLGADACHLGGCIRPSPYIPMPDSFTEKDGLDSYYQPPCPCSIFTEMHPVKEAKTEKQRRTTPYYKASDAKGAAYADPPTANWSIEGIKDIDASPDVLVLLAHDTSLLGVLPLLNDSDEDIGDWKSKGWKEATQWRWLNEMPKDGKPGRERIVKGFWRNGVEVPTFDG
jgi:glyoxylase-like metal-dependent hydrolase (beta-lactamase superfamily II)